MVPVFTILVFVSCLIFRPVAFVGHKDGELQCQEGVTEKPKQMILKSLSECVVDFPDGPGHNLMLRQLLQIRFVPLTMDKEDWTWTMKLEVMKLQSNQEKKVSFDLSMRDTPVQKRDETFLDVFQAGKLKLLVGPGFSFNIIDYALQSKLPIEGVPIEFKGDLAFLLSEPYLRSLAANLYLAKESDLKIGSGWSVEANIPSLRQSFGEYKFATKYIVTENNAKTAKIRLSQELIIPTKKVGPEVPLRMSVERIATKSTGTSVVDVRTRQIVGMTLESSLTGDLVIEIDGARTKARMSYKYHLQVETSK